MSTLTLAWFTMMEVAKLYCDELTTYMMCCLLFLPHHFAFIWQTTDGTLCGSGRPHVGLFPDFLVTKLTTIGPNRLVYLAARFLDHCWFSCGHIRSQADIIFRNPRWGIQDIRCPTGGVFYIPTRWNSWCGGCGACEHSGEADINGCTRWWGLSTKCVRL